MKPDVTKLEAARALIAKPGGWTKRAYARNSAGENISFLQPAKAVCWCAIGAIFHTQGNQTEIELLSRVIARRERFEVEAWNDKPSRTQAEVIAAFDRAIELARAQQ